MRRRCARRCARRRCAIEVALAAGEGSATAWGCDLGYDYVKLNADYTSLIVQTADGQLAKDDRLTNYSPTFKRTLLVEALVVHLAVRGHALRDRVPRRGDDEAGARAGVLQATSSCCARAASQPIVVHGHAPQNLVRLLNLDGGDAIGLSGNDGGLINARRRRDHGRSRASSRCCSARATCR